MNPKTEFKTRWCGQFKNLLALEAGVLLLCLASASSTAQTYTILHSFGTNVMGLTPQAPLVQGPDGTLYGTTAGGGSANQGQVFKVNADGTGYTVLKDFAGSDGRYPNGGLLLAGSTLYGTTVNGGTNDDGTVFAVNTDGGDYTVLKEFTGDDGVNPYASLVLSGTTLYGTTANGGTNGNGIVFKVGVDGTGFAVLHDFVGWPSDGANPYGCLALSDTTLYGTTPNGGSALGGTVFKISADGSGYAVLYDFGTLYIDSAAPHGGLLLSGNTLYGTSMGGGTSGDGTVFKINTDGSGCAVLHDFGTAMDDGVAPLGGLLLSGTTLYGTTYGGGVSGNGIVFAVSTDGTDFVVLKDFTNSMYGANANGGLILSGTTLYGTTYFGGDNGYGTVFKVETDGSDYTVVTDFVGGDGVNPNGNLLLSGTTLYGATYGGGEFGGGTLFKINADGSDYTVLKEFDGGYGANPNGGLVLSGSTLYGTTGGGGSSGNGTVFKLNPDGSGYAVLKDFTNSTDGAGPYGSLVLLDTTLYGTSGGGDSGNGTVFKVNTDGSGYTVLKKFEGSDGFNPQGGLVLSSTTLYGTTAGGGSNGGGTVFAVNTDGTGFTNLHSFTATDPDTGINSGGAHPGAGLILSGNSLYGTTPTGGSNGGGTVFAVNTDGTDFTVLKDFTDLMYAAIPNGGLILSGTTLYGTTYYGGGYFGYGTVFQVNTDGSGFAVLKNLTAGDGAGPQGNLALSGTTIYGTTAIGGFLDSGVLFSLSPGSPTIATSPEDQTIQAGSTIDLTVFATGFPTPAYQWFFNGTNAIDGATNSILELTNVLFSQSGTYIVVITNAYGSVTSSVATLTVQDPFFNSQPVGQSVIAGDTALFSVDARGTTPLSYQWFKDGLNLNDSRNISGSQTSTLTLTNAYGGNAGTYWLVVSNDHSSITSDAAVLTVQDPFISSQPVGQTIIPWQTVQFTVAAGGTAPFSYQWRKNGSTLPGQTTTLLTLDTAQLGEAGIYDVVVTGPYGSVTSTVASLIVFASPPNPVLHYFSGADGACARTLAQSGTTLELFGACREGGAADQGTLFKINADGTGFTVLRHLAGDDGLWPDGGLTVLDDVIYGTTSFGGPYNLGTLFRVNSDGTGFVILHNYDNFDNNGAFHPIGNLVLSGDKLYGLGSGNYGSIYCVNIDGSGFKTLKGSNVGGDAASASPNCLVLSRNTLYGTAYGMSSPGNVSYGMIFKMNTDGSGFSVLKSFAGSGSAGPCTLLISGTTLYGATAWGPAVGGSNWVFKINTDGTGFTVLKSFVPISDGDPPSKLILHGTTLYGATSSGGTNDCGTIFRLGTDDSGFAVIKRFNGIDGAGPAGDLVILGQTLYGTTMRPGDSDRGVIFALPLPEPTILSFPPCQTAEPGATIELSVAANGASPLLYQWYFNGDSLTDFSTNCWMKLTNCGSSSSGTYTVVITNVFGAVTSAPVMLNVIPSVERRPVPGLKIMGEAGSSLNVEHTESLSPAPNWLPLDVVNLTNPPQYCFDLTMPLLPQRYYRAWQVGTPSEVPSVNLNFVTAITLTGSIGDILRLDCINQIGPTDAWVTLGTVTLTNTTQLYFDTSAVGQSARLYRIVPVP